MVFPPPHCIRFMFASTKSSGILIGPFISLSALSLTVRSHRINILPRTPFTAHSPECSAQSRCINYLIWKGKASPRQALSLMKDKKKIAGPRLRALAPGRGYCPGVHVSLDTCPTTLRPSYPVRTNLIDIQFTAEVLCTGEEGDALSSRLLSHC